MLMFPFYCKLNTMKESVGYPEFIKNTAILDKMYETVR